MKNYLQQINFLAEEYPTLSIEKLGESSDGDILPLLHFGRGEREVLYIGTGELVNRALLDFSREYLSLMSASGKAYGLPLEYISAKNLISIAPVFLQNANDREYLFCMLRNKIKFCNANISVIQIDGERDGISYLAFKGAARTAYSLAQMCGILWDHVHSCESVDGLEGISTGYYNIGMGQEKSEFSLYTRMRRLLFCAPMLV